MMERCKRILVVDDCLENHLLYQLLFRQLYEVSFAANAEEGMEVFEKKGADLIVSDYEMPLKNGLWLLKMVHAASPKTPVIIVSSSFYLTESELLEAGAVGFVRRPFHPQILLKMMSDHL